MRRPLLNASVTTCSAMASGTNAVSFQARRSPLPLEDDHLDGLDVIFALERLRHRGGLRPIPFDEEDLHARPLARLVVDVRLDDVIETMLDPGHGFLPVLAVRDHDDRLDGALSRLFLPGIGHEKTERGSDQF